ncbi:MAG: glycosyltransferase [Pseudomonadales bacterium]|nr:glycosyltransferase [Pseudomonadales bacterium]
MKVIHIITSLNTGGAERALYNLLQGGLNEQFETHVISLSDDGTIGPQIERLGVPVITLGMPAGRPTLAGVIKLRRVIKDLQPDLIHGWMYHGNLVATLARIITFARPVLVWGIRHSLYQIEKEKRLTQLVIKANRHLSNTPDMILYNSHLSKQQHEQFGFRATKGQVIPNGINLEQFHFSDAERIHIRTELSIPTDAIVAGHVARLHPMKDHPLFLQAAVDIAQRFVQFHCILIGREVNMENEGLASYIPAELQNRFHLLDERTDISAVMSAMDIFTLTSAWGEAFPNVLGEAMATGLSCVTTDVGDSAQIVGDCGKIIEPQDKTALISVIESLLVLPSADRQRIGIRARRRIEEFFSLDAIVKEYSHVYESLISQDR